MIAARAAGPGRALTRPEVRAALRQGLAGRFARRKVLVLVPDHTRSLPLPFLFRQVMEILEDVRQLDLMVALGTHPPLNEAALHRLLGIATQERAATFGHINLLNHAWDDPDALATIGVMEEDEIMAIAGERWHPSLPRRVDIRINKAALAYDQLLVLGPTFPHEVAGYSGGAKYLFPGISGPEMIHASHWLGALAGLQATLGRKETPVRAMIRAASRRLATPVTLAALVVEPAGAPETGAGPALAGVFSGDLEEAWEAAADLSAQRHVCWLDAPCRRVLACAPPMYDELWTAAKAVYKLAPAVAPGGEIVLYAPQLETISRVHGKWIEAIGYHILPYFLAAWERFRHVPLGVLAHSSHLRGAGVMAGDIEQPELRVTLSSRIPAEVCARLNLGYLDPAKVRLEEWRGREAEGILHVPQAGEMLYRVKGK